MEPWSVLQEAQIGADRLVLRGRGGQFEIRMNGAELMSSRAHHSEEVMARLACARLGAAARILVGGLGMGYTLRAVLDAAPAGARVEVAEVFPELVGWNRDVLGGLTGHPLSDPRVAVLNMDVALALAPRCFDAILLDVDNGPDAVMLESNHALYGEQGLARMRDALRPGGTLAIWSADPSPQFEARLAAVFLEWRAHKVTARGAPDDPQHVIYVAGGSTSASSTTAGIARRVGGRRRAK
jgi:spermidine synthase